MLGWKVQKVKEYSRLQKVEGNVWSKIVECFLCSTKEVDNSTLFSEFLLRPIIPLLPEQQLKYLMGSLYNSLKSVQGGTGANQYNKEQKAQNGTSANTAEEIGNNHNVSKNTVKRAGAAVEKIKQAAPEAGRHSTGNGWGAGVECCQS